MQESVNPRARLNTQFRPAMKWLYVAIGLFLCAIVAVATYERNWQPPISSNTSTAIRPIPTTPRVPTVTPASTPIELTPKYVQDLYFVDALHGWLLGVACDESGNCSPEIRSTPDGGRNWQKITAPSANVPGITKHGITQQVSRVRFLNMMDGWVYGPSLFSTHDGGITWSEENAGGEIDSLELKDGSVWAIGRICPVVQSAGCASPTALFELNRTGRTWQPLNVQPLMRFESGLIRTSAMDAWIRSKGDIMHEEAVRVVATHDGGKSWRELSLPPSCYFSSSLAALADSELWFLCTGQPGGGSEPKALYHSLDDGEHWELVADTGLHRPGGDWNNTPYMNNLVFSAMADIIAANEPNHVWLSYVGDLNGAYESIDGGHTWTCAPLRIAFGSHMFFLDAKHAWVGENNSVSRTTDGGATWEHIRIYPPPKYRRGG